MINLQNLKKKLILTLAAVGTLPILFSSCSSTEKTAAAASATAHNSIADHEHYNSAAMGYDNKWPFGPDSYR